MASASGTKRKADSTLSTKRGNKKTKSSSESNNDTSTATATTTIAAEGEAFRRGGADVLTPLERKRIRAQATQDALFEEDDHEQSHELHDSEDEMEGEVDEDFLATKSLKKKKAKKSSKSAHTNGKTPQPRKIDGLSYKRMKKGMLVLGCVTKIGRRDVTLTLPNNLTGFIPLDSISRGLRKRLEEEEMGSSEEEEEDDRRQSRGPFDASRYLGVGQYVKAVVVSSDTESKKHIQLSTIPKDVNIGIKPEDLIENLVVQGEISSIEDHGAIVNLGLASGKTTAFISVAELGLVKLSSLEIGAIGLYSILKSTNGGPVVQLSADPKQFQARNCVKTTPNIESLLPGTVIDFIVQESTEHGIHGRMMDLVDVTADFIHSGQLVSQREEDLGLKLGKAAKARIIFVDDDGEKRRFGVSLLLHVLSLSLPRSPDFESGMAAADFLPLGSIVEETKITKVVPSRGLLLDIGVDQIPGFTHISRISEKRITDLPANTGQWQEGSIHRGRITGYNPMDGIFLTSLESRVLELPFLGLEDARPGQIVQGTVAKYKTTNEEIRGVFLKVTDNITGLVPANHLSDVQLQFPEKKYKIGSTVQARVLYANSDQSKLTLTCKKSLLKSKADIWSSYGDVRVGAQSPGTLIAFLPSGALIEFYGRLKGFLPASEMSESFIRDPKEHFHVGQVINLRAISVNSGERRLIVSCRQDTELTNDTNGILDKLKVGSTVSGKVTEKLADELVLDLENTSIKAILPISHLVDASEKKCVHAAERIRVDQILQDLAVLAYSKGKRMIRLTKRASLVKALDAGSVPSTFDALSPGMEITGFVKNITSTGVFVQYANNLTGLLPRTQIAKEVIEEDQFGLTKNQSITSRVLSVDPDQQRFFLTQRMDEHDRVDSAPETKAPRDAAAVLNPVDSVSTKFTMGQLTTAKITAVKTTQLNVKLADGVHGRVDVSQIFDSWEAIENKKQPLQQFQKGQLLKVKIFGVHDSKTHKFLPLSHPRGNPVFELTAKPSDQVEGIESRLSLATMEVGDSHLCFVNNVQRNHLWVNVSTEIRGNIRAIDLTEDGRELEDLTSHYPIGCAIQSKVLKVDAADNRLQLTALPLEKMRSQTMDDLATGQVVTAKVSKVLDKLVLVQISEHLSAAIHICDLDDDFSKADTKALQLHQTISAVVTEVDKERKDIWLSRRESKLYGTAAMPADPELYSIPDIRVNDIRRGFISNITDKGLFVNLSRNITVFVPVAELSDQFIKNWKEQFALNQLVKGKIISVNEATNQVRLSLKESVMDASYSAPLQFEDIVVGNVYSGKVRKVEDFGVFVVLDKSKNVSGLCHKSELADGPVSTPKDLYDEGDSVQVKILKIDRQSKRINLGMKASYLMQEDEDVSDDGDISMEDNEEQEDSLLEEGGVQLEGFETQHKVPQTTTTKAAKSLVQAAQGLDLGGFDWTGSLANDESDEDMLLMEEKPTETKKRKSGTAAIQIDRTGDLDANGAQSVTDFERLLLGQPNSSFLWLSYMAFHLQLDEVEQARQIAERALRTINNESVSTQDEALNVWIGFLNLENSYGDDDSIDEVFKRACTHSNPQEVYTRLASIYIQSDKHEKASTLFDEMVKKFSSDPSIWQNYASFLFDVVGDAAKARALLPRAMQSLPDSTHIDIATKFAQLEFKSSNGDSERGRTIFEGLITNFPKRLDLWNVLLDLEIKAGSKDQVRQLFDRVVSGKIKPQKAKFFFKKWLQYEEKEGDAKSQEKVKAIAAEFVRKHEEVKN